MRIQLPKGVKLRGGVYHLTIWIPTELRPHWPKTSKGTASTFAYRASLKTSDPSEAAARADEIRAEYTRRFVDMAAGLREHKPIQITPDIQTYITQKIGHFVLTMDDVLRHDPEAFAQMHGVQKWRGFLTGDRANPRWKATGDYLTPEQLEDVARIHNDILVDLKADLATGNTEQAKFWADLAVSSLSPQLRINWAEPKGKAALRQVLRELVKAWAGVRDRDRGEPVDTPAEPIAPASVAMISGPVSARKDGEVYLEDIVTAWAKERQIGAQSVRIHERAVERFHEYAGRHPVRELTKAHVVQFKDKMLETGQTATNTDSYLTNLRTLFNYAVANLKAEYNPADKIKVGERRNAKGARMPFDLPALRAIFTSPVYTEGFRPARIKWAPEAAYWFPLISLYSGARLEEIAQLSPDDIYEETYHDDDERECKAWVMRLTDTGEGQEVKNGGSVRRFPIHPVLIERGLVELVKARKGRKRIFDMPLDSRGREGAVWGKWFGKYLRGTCKVLNELMTFHSFRHTFKDVARARGIAKDVHNAISGHAGEDVADTVYGGLTYPLKPLVDAMSRYRILGLELPAPPPAKE
ncbi:site-specific integrase [Burkholderia multivorans]|uniref:site-specific integrase n=1 Tax=Burkholderia multivorans TaxID=87883 RepID=UPI001C213925|nr:site-specific integrase [Burkholderia multivorans]MBU9680846.1 site-specific integrase [Burkholderia multivorans]